MGLIWTVFFQCFETRWSLDKCCDYVHYVQPPRRAQGKKVPKRLNDFELKCAKVKQSLAEKLDRKLELLNFDLQDVDSDWITFRDTVYATAKEVLGPTTRKHQDCFDDNNERIQSLLEEKHRLHRSCEDLLQISAEMYTSGSPQLNRKLTELFQSMWN